MTTVTLSQARAKLSALVKRAQRGEDIGIVAGDRIIALRPVPVVSGDVQPLTPEYVAQEYGLSARELARFKDRQTRANAAARRRGFIIHYDNGQVAEVSWSFIRESPPMKKRRAKAR